MPIKGDRDWRPSKLKREAQKRKRERDRIAAGLPVPVPRTVAMDEGGDSTSYRSPYFLNPLVMAEQEERRTARITPQDYGVRWHSAYQRMLGPRPKCGPKDYGAAYLYLGRIKQALEQGGWTPGEWGRLHKLEEKWQRRAEGKDPVFEVMGNRGGRMSEGELERVETVRRMIEIGELASGQTKKMR